MPRKRDGQIMVERIAGGNNRPVQEKAEADDELFGDGRRWHTSTGRLATQPRQ